MVEASRIMNLYQFIQLYKDITSQAAEVFVQRLQQRDPLDRCHQKTPARPACGWAGILQTTFVLFTKSAPDVMMHNRWLIVSSS